MEKHNSARNIKMQPVIFSLSFAIFFTLDDSSQPVYKQIIYVVAGIFGHRAEVGKGFKKLFTLFPCSNDLSCAGNIYRDSCNESVFTRQFCVIHSYTKLPAYNTCMKKTDL